LPDGPAGQAASLAVAYEAARSDPVTAVELAGRLPPSARRDDLLIHALSQWAVSDASAARAWAMQVGQPDLRQHLVSAASVATAEQDGAAGALLAATALSSGNEQDCAVVSVVQRWAQQSPAETAAWISQFPEVPARAPAVQNLLAMWLPQDSQAARDWVETLPNSAFRAEAIAAYRMWERE
jgi:hypothetical protein